MGRMRLGNYCRFTMKRGLQQMLLSLCKSDVNYGRMHSISNLEENIERHHKKEYKSIMSDRGNNWLWLKLCVVVHRQI